MKNNIKLEKEKNEYFIEWIYKIWHHHDTIDDLYNCNYDVKVLNQHTLYINRLYIDEEYRNIGIGEEVIKKIIDIAKDMNRDIELEVFGNNPAIHLYEKMGFKVHYRDMILKI